MSDERQNPQNGAAPSHPGVTATPVTKRDADETLRKLSAATAPYFRSDGPLSATTAADRP